MKCYKNHFKCVCCCCCINKHATFTSVYHFFQVSLAHLFTQMWQKKVLKI